MLVLTRKNSESIVIGGPNGAERLVKLTVIRISSSAVKIGIEVADDVQVHRWEVWERISARASRGIRHFERSARPH
jgi:carbon storage regulator CsrA